MGHIDDINLSGQLMYQELPDIYETHENAWKLSCYEVMIIKWTTFTDNWTQKLIY